MKHAFCTDADGESRLFWHVQNLTGDWYPTRGKQGPIWRNGRVWVHLHDMKHDVRTVFGLQWVVGKLGASIKFGLSDDWENQVTAHIQLPGIALYGSLENAVPRRWLKNRTGRFTLYVMNKELWFSLWGDPMQDDRRWWRKTHCFAPLDWLLGKQVYSDTRGPRIWHELRLPEQIYQVQVRAVSAVWTRKRWPFPTRVQRYELTPVTPIPIPGKWDDEDCIYEFTTAAPTAVRALAQFRASVLDTRVRRGGTHWTPPRKETA